MSNNQWMASELHALMMKEKATDGKTVMDVFRSATINVLRQLSIEAKKNLTLEDGLTVVGNDLTAPGEGDANTGKMVESDLGKWRYEQAVAKAKEEGKEPPTYVPDMFVPRYMARTYEGKLSRRDGAIELVGNFVPILNREKGVWQILTAPGNPFTKGSDVYKLRELGLAEPKVAKLFPALTYAGAKAFIERATQNHQANVSQSKERNQMAATFIGKRGRTEGPEGLSKPRFTKGREKQGGRR